MAIHAAGVVHRDLKPGNVMLAETGPVVIDFGIAHAVDATRLTQTGMVMGTPGYLAPEVIEGQPSAEASDVHSWGATLAFAATGRSPYGGGSFETIFYRIVSGRADLSGVPGWLADLVAAALAKDPARRPSAASLLAHSRSLAGAASPVSAAAPNGTSVRSTAVDGTAVDGTAVDRTAVQASNGLPVRPRPARPGVAAANGRTRMAERGVLTPALAARDVADLLPPAVYPPRAVPAGPPAGFRPPPGRPRPLPPTTLFALPVVLTLVAGDAGASHRLA